MVGDEQRATVGILVGGGPAPGINSVIAAATIHSILGGSNVVGIMEGFHWIMEGDASNVQPLSIHDVSRIHFSGGSILGTSRANPTKRAESLENCLRALHRLEINRLITIGGDDTAFSALKLEQLAAGRLQVVHVPKTIDNDLDLPYGISTFGFQTARHLGVELVKNLMVDAKTTGRWYLIVTMGRKAGHLALGIGKAAGATLTLIPEEFHGRIRLRALADILMGSMIKRLAMGHPDGVAIVAEGLIEALETEDLTELDHVERDAHGHLRLGEINFGEILKRELDRHLRSVGVNMTVVAKNLGYELRSADPIPYDLEYTRDLGYAAAQFLLDGGNAAMISMQNGHMMPIPFASILDPATGRTRVRVVDTQSQSYAIARSYMIRLLPDDLADDHVAAQYATLLHMTPAAFRERFGRLQA